MIPTSLTAEFALKKTTQTRRQEVMSDPLRQELMDLANALVATSPEVLRLASNEKDETSAAEKNATHFIKFNGQRLGRDIELYGFMGELVGWPIALICFFDEVIKYLLHAAPESYAVACQKLKEMGMDFPDDLRAPWEELLSI